MSETIGSLIDKLTIVELKSYHGTENATLVDLNNQRRQLQEEIDEYLMDALHGIIRPERLVFNSNKVYAKEGNRFVDIQIEGFGDAVAVLASINCQIWHEQEKIYEWSKLSLPQKDIVIPSIAKLNLQRSKCIDDINELFQKFVRSKECTRK